MLKGSGERAGHDRGIPESITTRCLSLALSLLLLVPPPLAAQLHLALAETGAVQSGAPPFEEYAVAKDRLDKMFGLLARARSQLDRSSFDLDALLDDLDYESQDIIAFVKNEIRFEQYPGLLRGPLGTLMSRGGNALDQSVLLAKLLNDAGFEARIARGELTAGQATGLFEAALSSPPPQPKPAASPELIETVKELNRLSRSPNEVLDKAMQGLLEPFRISDSTRYRQVLDSARLIEAEMNAAAKGFSEPQPQPQILEEARDYFWVQHREGPAEAWADAHPALAVAAEFDTPVEPQGYLAGSVPAELQYQVRISAMIEQSVGGKRTVHELMSPWQRPAANLAGLPLTYSNHPDSLSEPAAYLDVETALRKASLYFPALNGALAGGSKAFDAMGRLIDSDVAGNQAAGVFKEVGDAFGKAASSIGGGSGMQLTRHWLEFSFIDPGGAVTTFERTIFALGEGEQADPLEMATKLSQEHTFMVSTGTMPGAYALDQVLRRLQTSQVVLNAILQRSYNPQVPVKLSGADLKQVESQWWGHYLLYPALADAEKLPGASNVYVSAPQFIVYSEEPPVGEGQRRVVDIVRNQRRALQVKDGVLHNAPTDLVLAGVWDTAMEGLVLSAEGRRSLDTFIAMEAAPRLGHRVILPQHVQAADELGLEPATLASLRDDLGRGYAVILPGAPGDAIQGWWRVDPASGETLGILYTGQGSAFTEALSLISGVISFAFWLKGMAGCVGGSANETQFSCCVATNSAFWIGGGIVGAYVSVAGVLASLGAFAGDMVYNMATARINLCGS